MLTGTQLCVELRIDPKVLERWIAEGWLLPVIDGGQQGYTEIDIARGRLIRELGEDLGVNEEGTGVILDLLDQIYGLRLALGLLNKQRTVSARRRAPPAQRRVQPVNR